MQQPPNSLDISFLQNKRVFFLFLEKRKQNVKFDGNFIDLFHKNLLKIGESQEATLYNGDEATKL